MKKNLIFIVLCFAFSSVFAQDKETAEKPELAKTAGEGIATLQLATDLAKYGYSQKSAVSLAQAAVMLNQFKIQEIKATKSEPSKVVADGKVAKKQELDPKKLFEDAKDFAKGNKKELQLIAGIQAESEKTTRGRTYGAGRVSRRVYGRDSYIDYIVFDGYALAEIAIRGDGDTDLDLYIYDDSGNLIASDTDYTDRCYASWYPRRTGTFKIVVKNRGSIFNEYLLLTN